MNGCVVRAALGWPCRGAAGIVRRIFEIMEITALLHGRAAAPLGIPATTPQQAAILDLARQVDRMSVTDLFVAYYALSGTADLSQMAA
jgi:hypothetical protein